METLSFSWQVRFDSKNEFLVSQSEDLGNIFWHTCGNSIALYNWRVLLQSIRLIVRELYKTVLAHLPSMLLIPIAIVPQAPVDLEVSFALG